MAFSLDDTIVAIASAAAPAPRGILRLSGETLATVLQAAFPAVEFESRRNARSAYSLPARLPIGGGQELDGRLLVWPSGMSYTRQPAAEFHLLGAPVLLQLGVEACCRAGSRLANPGEFTLRAFLAGRIDLTQAEAVLGLIDAESASAFEAALRQSAGGLAVPFARLRDELVELLAVLEATLDFIDQDIEFISRGELTSKLQTAEQAALGLQSQVARRRDLSTPPTVVLVGDPNAGKSSLFNRIAGSDLALTAPEAGTTRDTLRCRVEHAGVAWEMVDTAGLEQTAPTVADSAEVASERIIPSRKPSPPQPAEEMLSAAAQAQTLARVAAAEIVIWCVPAEDLANLPGADLPFLTRVSTASLKVATKIDQSIARELPADWIATSSRTGQGVDLLVARISELAAFAGPGEGEVLAVTAVRCAEQVRAIVAALGRARAAAEEGWGEELVAAELRDALDHLGQIAGTVYNDEILSRIFSRFCIGK